MSNREFPSHIVLWKLAEEGSLGKDRRPLLSSHTSRFHNRELLSARGTKNASALVYLIEVGEWPTDGGGKACERFERMHPEKARPGPVKCASETLGESLNLERRVTRASHERRADPTAISRARGNSDLLEIPGSVPSSEGWRDDRLFRRESREGSSGADWRSE